MSGFEVAGIVLGAFPIAISTVKAGFENYDAIARKLKLFYAFKCEYKICCDDLVFNRLMFKANLRQLLLPLVVSDEKVELLLANPGGPEWRQDELDNLLRRRLSDSYTLFSNYVVKMREMLCDLNSQLMLTGEAAKDKATYAMLSRKERVLATLSKENRDFLLYKASFSSAESARKCLLKNIRECNENLERLLSFNDKNTQLTQQRKLSDQKLSNSAAICGFWKHAVKLFRALASTSGCSCQATHRTELLLQHRMDNKREFRIDFMKFECSEWEVFETNITEKNDEVATELNETVKLLERAHSGQPSHRQLTPLRSSMKSPMSSPTTQLIERMPSITLTLEQPKGCSSITQEISNICTALSSAESRCCGFLSDECQRFYVSKLSYYTSSTSPSIVTLDQILTGDVPLYPTRKQRYGLALTLASSFLQLQESRWLPTPFTKVDVFFKSEGRDLGDWTVFPLNKPYVHKSFDTKGNGKATEPNMVDGPVSDSLDQLGILLLELCFGKILKCQPCREGWPEGSNAKETAAFDLLAARTWQSQVLEEAGSDFAEAVSWCLGGNRSVSPERWRQEMLLNVIERLQRCQDYLDTLA